MTPILLDETIERNTGRAFIVMEGQKIRITGRTTADFVAFNLNDLKERFDQARTKVNESKIFVTKGDNLWTKRNNLMFSITEDAFVNGHHDLQKGMCSRKRYELIAAGKAKREDARGTSTPFKAEDIPDHGCWENLSEALRRWKIDADDIPSPLNIFQHMEIDTKTGRLMHTSIRPIADADFELQARMDCLVGVSACPEVTHGRSIRVRVYP